ncbi:MAG: U32 family peptidase [Alphaproteobacteria bacterium]|nr:U32 family peptidase [Alphaproteobacteria bacterium]
MAAQLTLGPILFHWPAAARRDFYARIADEAPVGTVYLGEVVCSKRAPFFDEHILDVAARLERGGKTVVLSSLCEVMLKRERDMIREFAAIADREIEVNDASALFHASGRPHRIGTMMNVYNEVTLAALARRGATHFCLPGEVTRAAVSVLAARAAELGVGIEVQVFGRLSLAVSARCYHARAHGRAKDNCQFVCEEDPDGMTLSTIAGQPFLAVNGIQTLSHSYVDLLAELGDIVGLGVTHLRLSPHTQDMVATASVFRDVLDGRIEATEGQARLRALRPEASFSNGFWHGKAGHIHTAAAMRAG